MIIVSPLQIGGDSYVYLKVAENIFLHGCVSLSDPASGACVPHWGGNQLPGYPAFISGIWMIFGKSILPVLFSQVAIVALASGYLCKVLSRTLNGIFQNSVFLLLVAFLLGASPSLIGWSRAVLTETLSIALALWLLAELIASLQERNLRFIRIGIVLTLGVFVRYDFMMFSIPVAAVGFYLHSPSAALRKGSCIILIILVPLGGWMARGVSQGLEPTPPFGLTPQGLPLPEGMLGWVGTWLDNQYDLGNSVWALVRYNYSTFSPPSHAYKTPEERAVVRDLISQLRDTWEGKPPPTEIDEKFGRISAAKIDSDPFEHWVLLPLRRISHMWLTPYPSMGWPAEISGTHWAGLRLAISLGNLTEVAKATLEIPGTIAMKVLVSGHRYLLLLLVFAMVFIWRRLPAEIAFLSLTIVGFAILRSAAFSYTFLNETRYLTLALAWLDVLLIVMIFSLLTNRKTGEKAARQK
jgi:hypothetical protein